MWCMQEQPSGQIDAAVDRAVKKTFAILGVDVNDPESVEQFREDLRFGRRMRRAADKGWTALVGIIFVGGGMLLWQGLVDSIKHLGDK